MTTDDEGQYNDTEWANEDRGGVDFAFVAEHEAVNPGMRLSDLDFLYGEQKCNPGRESLALDAQRNQRNAP